MKKEYWLFPAILLGCIVAAQALKQFSSSKPRKHIPPDVSMLDELPPPPDPEWENYADGRQEPVPLNLDEFKYAVGYPQEAKEAEITGKVVVRVEIDTLGNYVRHEVLKDPDPILTDAVTRNLPVLQFSPGVGPNGKEKVWVTIPIDFQLNDR